MKLPSITRAQVRAYIPRFLFCVLGNFLIGFGVGMTKLAAFGIEVKGRLVALGGRPCDADGRQRELSHVGASERRRDVV